MVKQIAVFALELLIAALLLQWSQSLFFLYLFFSVIFVVNQRYNHLRRMMRIYQVTNECKIMAIATNLGVTTQAIAAVFDETKAKLTPKQLASLEKDWADLVNES
jgi:hypothetical protein